MIRMIHVFALLCIIYICTGCVKVSEYKSDGSSVKARGELRQKIAPYNSKYFDFHKMHSPKTSVLDNKVVEVSSGVSNYTTHNKRYQNLSIAEENNKVNRQIDQELLEKNRIDRLNSTQETINRYNQSQTIIRNNEKATAYYNNQKNSALKQ